MRVVVAGATGAIGRLLVAALTERGDDVTVLTRDRDKARTAFGPQVTAVTWANPKDEPAPEAALHGRDGVVNLLGEPIAQRWSDSAKREICDSRVLGTRNLVAGLRALPDADRPRALVSGSGINYYGPHGDERVDESQPAGEDFLAHLVAAWEQEARAAEELGLRIVLSRTGVVLFDNAGALQKMLPPFKLGVGGPVAGGRQYVPWIHADDAVGALIFCLDNPDARGPVNLAAPEPVTNRELSKTLGRVLRRPAVLPVPALALKLLYGEMAVVVTAGVRGVPARLEQLGYEFRRRELEAALRDLLA